MHADVRQAVKQLRVGKASGSTNQRVGQLVSWQAMQPQVEHEMSASGHEVLQRVWHTHTLALLRFSRVFFAIGSARKPASLFGCNVLSPQHINFLHVFLSSQP